MDIVLHPASRLVLEATSQDLPHALLLHGQRGIGLTTAAQWLAGDTLTDIIRPQNTKGETDEQGGTITIETIRRLYDQTRAKRTARQVVVVDGADKMSRGAQSAFLKLLEEPNSTTHFILTSHAPSVLLPTIRSRVQAVALQPLTAEQSTNHISSLGVTDVTKKSQLQFLAPGLPAELSRLAQDEAYFAARAKIIGDARDFLQASTYQKLRIVQRYRASREDTLQLLDSAIAILRRTLGANPQRQLVVQLDQLLDVRERIASNQNIALQLTQFVL